MNKCTIIFRLIIFALILTACMGTAPEQDPDAGNDTPGIGPGMMGRASGMHARHTATIPQEYSGKRNPQLMDDDSLERGEQIYQQNCATCHGDGGMGDGPAGAALDPSPSPVAHTSMMMGDDYLFWRISEGGLIDPFNSAMPAWKDALKEQARWDTINYLRALGSGRAVPQTELSGRRFDPNEEAALRAEMLAQAVEQKLITKAEAEAFDMVHAAMDNHLAQQPGGFTGRMQDAQTEILAELVATGAITQEQADIFSDVHDRLLEAGLMQ